MRRFWRKATTTRPVQRSHVDIWDRYCELTNEWRGFYPREPIPSLRTEVRALLDIKESP